jgi:single-strand DNA-binding protein
MTIDTMVTVQGWLGNEPQLRQAGSVSVANFRVGSTPRRFNRAREEWVDGPTQWYGVSAWRTLGEHCKRSLHVGDPVVVHGRLSQRSYDRDGVEVTVLEIEAYAVGHDLTRGVSSFIKAGATRRDERQEQAAASVPTVVDPWAASAAESPGTVEVVGAA